MLQYETHLKYMAKKIAA